MSVVTCRTDGLIVNNMHSLVYNYEFPQPIYSVMGAATLARLGPHTVRRTLALLSSRLYVEYMLWIEFDDVPSQRDDTSDGLCCSCYVRVAPRWTPQSVPEHIA